MKPSAGPVQSLITEPRIGGFVAGIAATRGEPGGAPTANPDLESGERRKRDSERRGFRIVGNQPDAWTRESPTAPLSNSLSRP